MNLTKLSALFRKSLKILFIFAVLYYVWILILLPISKGALIKIFKPKDPATPTYGLLEPLEFIQKPTLEGEPQIVLNTSTGKLPKDFPKKILVYKFKPMPFSYLAGESAQKDAAVLGFTDRDLISDLKGNEYKWRSLETGSILEIKTESRKLEMNTNLSGKMASYPRGTITEDQVKKWAVSLAKNIFRFDDLYSQGDFGIHYGIFSGGNVVETKNYRESQIAKVHLYRKIDDYLIFGPDPKRGMINITLKKPDRKPSPLNNPVIEAYHWDIESRSNASYPIIRVEDAWKAVEAGQGVISGIWPNDYNPFESYRAVKLEKILIDNIYLAYYDNYDLQKHLQPIYVFEGKYTTRGTSGGEVYIYFPALSGEYTQKITRQ